MSKSRQLRLGAFMRPVSIHTGASLCAKITGYRGRRTASAADLCLQQWYKLSDPGAEEALYDICSVRAFAGLELGRHAQSVQAQRRPEDL